MEKVRAAATVGWDQAVDFAAEAFAATGVPTADARKAAEALVDADLHGTVTHGLKNLRNYISQLLDGRISEDSRGPGENFGPAVAVSNEANDQAKLLAYCGRTP